MAWTAPKTDFAPGNILNAAQMNAIGNNLLETERVLGKSNALTATFTTSATHTTYQDVTNLDASITYEANRLLRATLEVNPYASGGVQGMIYKLVRASTDVKEFGIAAAALDLGSVTTYTYTCTFAGPGTSATETFKVQLKATTSNTAVQNFGNATYISRLIIEDVGPA